MRRKRTLKYYAGRLHLWFGLASGLVVLIVSVTGCLFVFQKEITEAVHHDRYYIRPQGRVLPLVELRQKAQAVLGAGQPLSAVIIYREPGRTWEFMSYHENDTALTIFGGIEYYRSVFLDPYTGTVTGFRDYKYDFFSVVKYLHWSLLLNTPYGQPIVAGSTVLFIILLLTGLVLWWPRRWTKAYRDRSFRIKWTASFRRVNYDLHNVPGFYSLFPALVIAVTGLIFIWPPATLRPPVYASTPAATSVSPMDRALQTSLDSLPAAARFAVSPAFGPEGVIYVYAYTDAERYYGYDVLQFDAYSGRLLHHLRNHSKTRMQRMVEMNYDLHVGAIAGLTGKIIAFVASLICASLPVTGFLVWWFRKRGSRFRPKDRFRSGPKIA